MRRPICLLTVCIWGIFATGAGARARPDFSGAWTSAPLPATRADQSELSAALGSGWGSSITIVQCTDALTVERVFFSPADLQPPLKFRYSLNGSETRNTVMVGRGIQEQVSTTAWEGDKLVIQTVHTFQNPGDGGILQVEVKQTLSLEPARQVAWPPSLVVETTRGGVLGGPSSTNRTVYTKQ